MTDSEKNTGALSDQDRAIIANGLRLGGMISFALLVLGLILRAEGHFITNSRLGNALLHAGLVSLLATPVVRILTALWLYWRTGNRRFAAYSLISLLVVAASVAVGILFRG